MKEKTREFLKSINKEAESVGVENNVPIVRYFNSGLELEKMGQVYMKEGNLLASYYLFTKLLILYLEKLPKHPGYQLIPPSQKNMIKTILKRTFPTTESIKSQLIIQLDQEYMNEPPEDSSKVSEQTESPNQDKINTEAELFENKSTPIAPTRKISVEPIKLVDSQPASNDIKNDTTSNEDKNITSLNEKVDSFNPDIGSDGIQHYAYAPLASSSATNPPVYELIDKLCFNEAQTPSFDRRLKPQIDKTLIDLNLKQPMFDRCQKPQVSAVNARTMLSEFIKDMRRLLLPDNLIPNFIDAARLNTVNNKETCGIIVGKMNNNSFYTTHILVPKQSGASDSCSCTNDDEIFDYQVRHDLITLGWIHTHPSQTCFLSSIDLHTQYGYQCLLKESVAIVVSDKYQMSQIYSLTPRGLGVLRDCCQEGFHLHQNSEELFEVAKHINTTFTHKVTLVDFRFS